MNTRLAEAIADSCTERTKTKPQLIVTGLGGHGKDTLCEMAAYQGYTWKSSSEFACEHVVWPAMYYGYNYASWQECFEDRRNHRAEWYQLISRFNRDDPARLGKMIFAKYDIYCGIRSIEELEAVRKAGLVDYVIWVDAKERLGVTESEDSISICSRDCDITVTNNDSIEAFDNKVKGLLRALEASGK